MPSKSAIFPRIFLLALAPTPLSSHCAPSLPLRSDSSSARFLRLRLRLGRPPFLPASDSIAALPSNPLLLPAAAFLSRLPLSARDSFPQFLLVGLRRVEESGPFVSGSCGAPDMCVEGLEDAGRLDFGDQDLDKHTDFAMERVCENTVSVDFKQTMLNNFVPFIRSGEWSDIGGRDYMEDAHVCISDLAKNFGCEAVDDEVISFYGVFDGHGGKDAAHYVRDNLPRVIVEDADFPLQLEKVVKRSFVETDSKFAETFCHHKGLSSGTTALTAMIFGRSLLVANAGDCRAVLSRRGTAIEMSKDHRPCCINERKRVESLGGYVDDGYLNGQLAVTRALGDWHLEGMKEMGEPGGPLSAEPELKMITLTKDDEFLIIGSDGIWDFFSNQNAVDFARRRLQDHNDLRLCCREIVDEAIRRGGRDNLTAVMVSFHQEAPPQTRVNRTGRVARSISAEGLHNLRVLLEGQ